MTALAFPAPLAPYAARAEASRGRLYAEAESPTRTPFQRDRDRVVHCAAFRRLKHKTQVFVEHEGDHYRTRLTHSLEVAQISRSIARTLKLDEDLAECVALAHDLGHPPFGHTGEDALQECMAPFGGFDHNAQALRILTKLERRYAAFDGLNLTWETLEGVVKHNGPLIEKGKPSLPAAIAEYGRLHDLDLRTHAGLEAQVAAIADDIAYNNHDIDDGLRAGLFSFEEACDLPLIGAALERVIRRWPDAPREVQIAEAVSALIGRMIADVVDVTNRRIAALKLGTADDARRAGLQIVGFSDPLKAELDGLRSFLHKRVYRHERVNRERDEARAVVKALFARFMADQAALPEEWRTRSATEPVENCARIVCDYIAGMTDRFALREHERLCGEHEFAES
jgi:dGTPase